MKIKMKTKMKNKMKTKAKMKMNVRFCFHFAFDFRFCFCFCFLKVFAFLLTPHGLSLDWPRSARVFLLTPCSLEVLQMVNLLLLGLEVPQHFRLRFSMWPSSAIDGQFSLDWPRTTIAPNNMAPSLIQICRIQ